ncbi:MAG: hypothetical protein AAGF49_03435 [Pseudomonadota bacterium]
MAESRLASAWEGGLPARRPEGKGTLLLRCLAVHAVSVVAFVLADAVMMVSGTNRTMADLYLGMGGFVFGALAIATTITAAFIVALKPHRRHEWPWLFAHLAAVVAVLGMASAWMAMHIA